MGSCKFLAKECAQSWLTRIVHILLPETCSCPSWISGRERMAVENISWSISTKECCRPGEGRTRNLLITCRTRIQLSHRGRLPRRGEGYSAEYFLFISLYKQTSWALIISPWKHMLWVVIGSASPSFFLNHPLVEIQIREISQINIFLFSMKSIYFGFSLEAPLLMTTHNICFREETRNNECFYLKQEFRWRGCRTCRRLPVL